MKRFTRQTFILIKMCVMDRNVLPIPYRRMLHLPPCKDIKSQKFSWYSIYVLALQVVCKNKDIVSHCSVLCIIA